MSATSVIIVAALAALVGSIGGFLYGRKRGTAIGWLDRYFEEVARDRARRNKLGQYKAQEARHA